MEYESVETVHEDDTLMMFFAMPSQAGS